MSPCPGEAQLSRFASGRCDSTDAAAIEAHLRECERCRDWVERARTGRTQVRPAASNPHEAWSGRTGQTTHASFAESNENDLPSIPGYVILQEIHSGGQGAVFQAIQKSTKRRVAIKVMHEGPFASAQDRSRFEREVEILGQLNHPNIVGIHDSGTAAGSFYYVMDYISGQPLDAYVTAAHPSIAALLELFVKVCDAVNAAHLRGIIHRDLKPGNIRVDSEGEPHVLDFGLAKIATGHVTEGVQPHVMTMTGQFFGSLPWASPEQAEGSPSKIDVRSDVYSLGVVLYQLLTSQFPYEVVGAIRDIMSNILQAEPSRPSTIRHDIDDEVDTIVLKCLSKDRERRYQSAGEVARDIRHHLRGEPIEAKRESSWYLLRKSLRRHRLALSATLVLLFIGLAFGAVMTVMFHKQRHLNEIVTREQQKLESRNLAEQKVLAAEQCMRWREKSELAQARELLNEAIALSPDYVGAYLDRGFLSAVEALQASLDVKGTFVEDALQDFHRAHLAAGGAPVFDQLPPEWEKPIALGAGSQAALRAAYDLLLLTRGPESDISTIRALAEAPIRTPAGGPPPSPSIGSGAIYSVQTDRLIARPPSDSPAAARRPVDRSARIVRLLPVEIGCLDPLAPQTYESYVIELIYDPLFVVDAQMQFETNPAVVESVSVSEDNRVWTVQLKDGLTWHNGEPLRAADVEYTWQKLLPEKQQQQLQEVRALDEHRVRYTHHEASPSAMLDMTFNILPKSRCEALWAEKPTLTREELLRELARHPIGNGPYRIVGEPGRHGVELTRWEEYSGEKPYIAGVTFRVAQPGTPERLRMLASGRADAAVLTGDEFRWDVNGESFAEELIKVTGPKRQYDYICWNLSRAGSPFVDPRVRRAMAMALDLDRIREAVSGGVYRPCHGVFDPSTWMGKPMALLPYDVKQAERLLDAAGWTAGSGGESVRTKDGQRFEFSLLIPEEARWFPLIGIIIREQLAAVGVAVNLEYRPFLDCQSLRQSGDFEALISSVVCNPHPCQDRERWTTGREKNYGGYSNDEVDRLFETARRTLDGRKEAALYGKIQELIYEDQPYLFLWQKPTMWAFNRRIHGVELSPFGPVRFYPGPRSWWVPAEQN